MENDLNGLIQIGESKRLTQEKYLELVDLFANISEHSTTQPEELKELKLMLHAFQTLSDSSSIKILERLFIQLLGHINVKFF
jgi:hypothetical protein